MWIKRYLEDYLRRANRQRPVVLLTGARQTGKTSTLQRLFPNHPFVSLDLPSEAEQAEKDGSAFLARHPGPLIIDEVQYAPGLFRHLKVAVEKRRSASGQFLLTGSQKFTLMKSVSESLAGRVEVVELEPLSLAEIHPALPELGLEEVLLRGGYPELYQKRELEAPPFYRSYVATYLERDLRSALNVSNLRDFERFLRAAALRSGQLLNKADLARDAGISPSTANQWLSVLAASNLVILLEPWFINRSKSITKSPKLFFADTGLLLFLLNIHTLDDLLKSPLIGSIWETFIFAELRKRQAAQNGHWSIHFYRDRGLEIDFLIPRGGRYELIEAKWTESPAARDLQNLERLARIVGEKNILRRSVICRTPNPFPIARGIQATSIVDYQPL